MRDIKDQSDKIKQILDDMKYGLDISFDEFLNKLSLTEEQYIRAVRFSLNRDHDSFIKESTM